jgi:hypothetical protein
MLLKSVGWQTPQPYSYLPQRRAGQLFGKLQEEL